MSARYQHFSLSVVLTGSIAATPPSVQGMTTFIYLFFYFNRFRSELNQVYDLLSILFSIYINDSARRWKTQVNPEILANDCTLFMLVGDGLVILNKE